MCSTNPGRWSIRALGTRHHDSEQDCIRQCHVLAGISLICHVLGFMIWGRLSSFELKPSTFWDLLERRPKPIGKQVDVPPNSHFKFRHGVAVPLYEQHLYYS